MIKLFTGGVYSSYLPQTAMREVRHDSESAKLALVNLWSTQASPHSMLRLPPLSRRASRFQQVQFSAPVHSAFLITFSRLVFDLSLTLLMTLRK